MNQKRVILLIIDGCGIGAAPDFAQYNDTADCNTLANVAKVVQGLNLPNLYKFGLGNICNLQGLPVNPQPLGVNAKLEELSCAKDTQTGHWEMMGLVSEVGFPLYPQGFPPEVIQEFITQTGCQNILVNLPYSGTKVLDDYGDEHCKSSFPIVYTSGDSVFQIACHTDIIPIEKQYKWCEIARSILTGKHNVGRVIARPFNGVSGSYQRISALRHDYTVLPPRKTLLDELIVNNLGVLGIGKIEDIFCKQGLSHAIHTGSNLEGLKLTIEAMQNQLDLNKLRLSQETPENINFIFTNLVDTDSLYGHRRDAQGYYKALKEIDNYLGNIQSLMTKDDLVIISSDHGNDPTATGTDHTREYVPFLMFNSQMPQYEANLGALKGFSQIGLAIEYWLKLNNTSLHTFKEELDPRIVEYLYKVA